MTIPQRLAALRSQMKTQGWAAFVDTGTDPHDSEYMPSRWESRLWLSGFTGSAGTVVVTADRAGLWTDGRYFLQAEAELSGTGIELFKEGQPGTPLPMAWLSSLLPSGAVIGADAQTLTWSRLEKWRAETTVAGLKVEAGSDLLEAIWTDRPGLPSRAISDHQTAVAGLVPRQEKIAALRKGLKACGADAQAITALDELAWLFNLRGSDILFTPVFLGWGWVDQSKASLFVQHGTLSPESRQALKKAGIDVYGYGEWEARLPQLVGSQPVLVVRDRTNAHLMQSFVSWGVQVVEGVSPLTMAKAKKTDGEIELSRQAHLKDGAALVEFLAWFATVSKDALFESDAAKALDDFRGKRGDWKGPSFTAIPGFRENGAIIHYHASGTGARLAGRGLFLLDTGAQYIQGTTDVTRTLVLGEPTRQEIEDYTLVLKAHVQVSLMPFPVGTRGYMVDALARRVLWKNGRNFNHGTGHGVGVYLAVHEGPARLNAEPIPTVLEPGMILSNEPGLYRPGKHGIRIENLVTVIPAGTTEFASFLCWETLTLCPYERKLIDVHMLEADEREWIDAYHQRVAGEVTPTRERLCEDLASRGLRAAG